MLKEKPFIISFGRRRRTNEGKLALFFVSLQHPSFRISQLTVHHPCNKTARNIASSKVNNSLQMILNGELGGGVLAGYLFTTGDLKSSSQLSYPQIQTSQNHNIVLSSANKKLCAAERQNCSSLSLTGLSCIFQQLNFFAHRNPQEACVSYIKINQSMSVVTAQIWLTPAMQISRAIKHKFQEWDWGIREEQTSYETAWNHKRIVDISLFIASHRDVKFNRNSDVSDISLPMKRINTVCQKICQSREWI